MGLCYSCEIIPSSYPCSHNCEYKDPPKSSHNCEYKDPTKSYHSNIYRPPPFNPEYKPF